MSCRCQPAVVQDGGSAKLLAARGFQWHDERKLTPVGLQSADNLAATNRRQQATLSTRHSRNFCRKKNIGCAKRIRIKFFQDLPLRYAWPKPTKWATSSGSNMMIKGRNESIEASGLVVVYFYSWPGGQPMACNSQSFVYFSSLVVVNVFKQLAVFGKMVVCNHSAQRTDLFASAITRIAFDTCMIFQHRKCN